MNNFRWNLILLFLTGFVVLTFVTVQSIRQIANYKTTLALTGFEIKNNEKYYISGYLNLNTTEGFDNEFDNQQSKNKFLFSDSEIPYIGKIYNDELNKSMFIVSGNVYSENRKHENALNVLFPKCYLEGGKSKRRGFDDPIEPGTRVDEELLLKNKLYFVDRVSGLTVFKLWLEIKNEKKIVKTSTFIRTVLNFNGSDRTDCIKLVGSKNYTLRIDDPRAIYVLPNFQSDKSEIIKIQKTGFRKYNLLDTDGNVVEKLTRKKNTFYWNGWEFSLLGLPSCWFILGSLLCLFFCWWFFLQLIFNKIGQKLDNPVLQVESRILFILTVYVIFTALSILFINHIWLSTQYERTYWMLFLSIPTGFIIAYHWINRKEENKFGYDPSDRNPRNMFSLEDPDGKYVGKRLLVFFIVCAILVVSIAYKTRNERLVLMGDIGIPIIHLSKILVCVIIYAFRDKLFKGDMIAHLFLWLFSGILSIFTKDLSSLLFTIICYFVVCKIFLGTVNIPNPLKKDAWIASRKNIDGKETYHTIKNKFVLFAMAIILFGALSANFPSKFSRLFLTYTNLYPDNLLHLSNGHKESYAKIYWTLQEIFQNGLAGTFLDFRAVNFYTTWHTDLAFLSFLQYGGLFFIIVLSILLLLLLYNCFFSFISLNPIFKNLANENQMGPTYTFVHNNVYVLFLLGYLLIQTVYPILCNLTLLPLTGQAIPGLSVSIVEYILTPLMLAYIYSTIGRVVHHELMIERINAYNESTSDYEINYHVSKRNFYNIFIEGKYKKTVISLFIFSALTVVLLVIKIGYFNQANANNDNYTFQYVNSENKDLNKLIEKTNDSFIGINKDSTEIKKVLLANANNFVLNTKSVKKAKTIISAMKDYFYNDCYINKKSVSPYFAYDNNLGIVLKPGSERIVKNRIRKNTVVRNMSYAGYFDEQKLYFDEEIPFIKNETQVFESNGKVIINSDFLAEEFVGNSFFASTNRVLNNKKYDGLGNYYTFKTVNGKQTIVVKYPSVGDINFAATTYDMDLQAILTLYLKNFVRQDNNKKIASIVIAENSTGKIRAMTSYPSYANKFGDEVKTDFEKFQKLKLISHLDVNELQNYALADAMPGSTFKPIYTFAALANDSSIANNRQIFNPSIEYFIRRSDPNIARKLFRNQYAVEGFGEQMFKCFNIKVFEFKDYGKIEWDNLASDTYIIDASQFINDRISEKTNNSSAWGQGNVQMSLATLVRDFIRINKRKAIKLSFTEPKQVAEDFPISETSIRPLYDGMNEAVFAGTAIRVGNELKRLYGQNFENGSLYMGKTGTVEIPVEFQPILESQGVSFGGNDNLSAYMILISPSHTIGVSLMGILPNSENDSHAKGIMTNMLELLKNWRNGMYLQ